MLPGLFPFSVLLPDHGNSPTVAVFHELCLVPWAGGFLCDVKTKQGDLVCCVASLWNLCFGIWRTLQTRGRFADSWQHTMMWHLWMGLPCCLVSFWNPFHLIRALKVTAWVGQIWCSRDPASSSCSGVMKECILSDAAVGFLLARVQLTLCWVLWRQLLKI